MAAFAALLLPVEGHAATLSDSVTQALATHPGVDAGKAAAAAAAKELTEERAGYFPSVGFRANAGREHLNNSTTRGIAGPGGATSWVNEHAVTLTQPIFSGFGTVNRTDAARNKRDAVKLRLGEASEDLALQAARAHLNLMRTQELMSLARGYYKNVQELRDRIGLMVSEGMVGEDEKLQAESILMAARNTRLGYEEAWHQAEADYIQVVGKMPDTTLELGEASWTAKLPETLDTAIAQGLARNPVLLSADKSVAAYDKEADAARGSLLFPHLDAELSYDRKNQGAVMGGNSDNAAALLRLSWGFSTGGAEIARIGRSADARAEAVARRHMAARGVEHGVRQKFTSMQIVDEQFDVLSGRESAVQKILDSAIKQFEAGRQSNLQIISAHAGLFDAKAARVDAHYRKLLSRFELLGEIGDLRQAFGVAPTEAETLKESEGLLGHVWGD